MKNAAAIGVGTIFAAATAAVVALSGDREPTQEEIYCGILSQGHLHLEDEMAILEELPPEVGEWLSQYQRGQMSQEDFLTSCLGVAAPRGVW